MKLVTSAEMRAIDSRAINDFGIPGIDLMENAGRGIAEWIRELFDNEVKGKRFAIFCGKGNNAGDGYVIARYLLSWGAEPEIIMLAKPAEIKGDALTNFQRLQAAEATIHEIDGEKDEVVVFTSTGKAAEPFDLRRFDMVIDAIFGTGFTGKVDPRTAAIIDRINSSGVNILAVDTPSGLNSDTGTEPEIVVAAQYTATLALPKVGQCFYPGRSYCGLTKVINIGIPDTALQGLDLTLNLITRDHVESAIPDRAPTIHKGDAGKLFIIAGSEGLTGAATLSAQSAVRAGCGLVTVGCPRGLNDILEIKLTEAMTKPLPEIKKRRCLAIRALGDILVASKSADAVALGPGLGRHHETIELVQRILGKLEKPTVIDADGLYALTGHTDLIRDCKAELVLTPHAGEFERLTGQKVSQDNQGRISAVSAFARDIRKVVLLKGAPTLVATPSGEVFVNPTGNPGMATGGSGDVLTGIIGAFLASGMDALDSALCGAYVHGLAGDTAQQKLGTLGMSASDMVDFLPISLKSLKDKARAGTFSQKKRTS